MFTAPVVAFLAAFGGSADTTVVLGTARRDLTGDSIPELLRIVGVGPTIDSLEVTFTVESAGNVLFRRRLASLTRSAGFDAGRRRLSAAEHRARLAEIGSWFLAESKFDTPGTFMAKLRHQAPRHVDMIPSVIDRSRAPNDTRAGAAIWQEILASRAIVFSFSAGGDNLSAIAWSAQARRFYDVLDCC